MNKKRKLIIIISIILVIIIAIIIYLQINKIFNQPFLGSSCGTVNPQNADECCYRQFKEQNKFPTCANPRIIYNVNKAKCEYECDASEGIACTEDAMQCPDGTWTSRTPALNCRFIPCGYK